MDHIDPRYDAQAVVRQQEAQSRVRVALQVGVQLHHAHVAHVRGRRAPELSCAVWARGSREAKIRMRVGYRNPFI